MRIGFFFYLLIFIISCSEKKDTFQFKIQKNEGIALSEPVPIDLNKVGDAGVNLGKPLVLIKELDGETVPIDFQLDKEGTTLWFVRDSEKNAEKNAIYRIENGVPPRKMETYLSEHKENGDLQLALDNKPLLSYRYEMTYPPEGVDSVHKKSGYIHPVITPKGDTLSRIQPPDHYHHYGIWGPWTHTQIDSRQVDFWNLGDRRGTVLFKEFNDTESGEVYASFNAAQEHVDLLAQEKPQVALNENLEVTLWNLMRDDRYMFDYNSKFSSPLEDGILFEAYRYGGGIGMRFTERWKADNCSVLTSEGKDRLSADGTNARWCIVSGASADGKGTEGILFMSHPENRAHPEPMRVWPIDANGGRGDMFFEFCPIRHKEWQIEPNKDYELKYRMVVFDGELNADEAEAYWQAFANPPEAQIIKN
jgi:hypothetical protein